MLIGLCGPTDLRNLRRLDVCSAWCKHAYWFDDLTVEFCKALPLVHKGSTYSQLVLAGDVLGVIELKQKVESAIRKLKPTLYTDWMATKLLQGPFSKGLTLNPKVTEAIIGDVRYEEQARWLRTFGVSSPNRHNKLIFVDVEQPLPPELSSFEGEAADFKTDGNLDVFENLEDEIYRLKKRFYLE